MSIAGTKMSVPFASNKNEVDCRTGAESRQAPADTEQGRTEHHLPIDILRNWKRKPLDQNRSWPSEGDAVTEEGYHDRAEHHANQARIEAAG